MRVILLCYLNLREEVAIKLQGRGQMIQRLLKVAILEVGFTQFSISGDENEQILLVDVHEELAEGKLLDPYLDHTIGILAHSELVKCLVALHQLPTDAVVHLGVLLLSVHRLLHLLLTVVRLHAIG